MCECCVNRRKVILGFLSIGVLTGVIFRSSKEPWFFIYKPYERFINGFAKYL